MSDAIDVSHAPVSAVRRSRRLSPYWLVPILAALIALWLAWDTWSREGPTITVSFDGAEGLQAGQSKLKYRDVTLGTVQSIRLSPDHKSVRVTIATARQATPLLTNGTIFWVVKPRLFAGSLTGLSTLVSGSYIAMVPGPAGHARRDFVGQEEPPLLSATEPGRTFLLKSSTLGSVEVGAPVFYRNLNVGQVLGWDLGKMARNVTIHVFVRSPFDEYVHDNSRFWDASGVSVKLSGTGVSVQLQSLRALLLGGIAFGPPPDEAEGAASPAGHVFPLFATKEAALAASYTRRIDFVAYFPGSVRGLAKGAEVTVHGLKVGEVTGVSLAYDPATQSVVAPVTFQVQPERIVGVGRQVLRDPDEAVHVLVQQGLRASLQSANLLTGAMLVALDFHPDAPAAQVTRQGDAFVLPTLDSGSFSGLEASLSDLLRKVNAVPLDKIGANLEQMTAGADQLVNGPELKRSLASLDTLLATTQSTVKELDAGLAPAARKLPALAAGLQKTLADANGLLRSLNGAYGDNTRFNRELTRSLAQLNESLRSIQALADLLSRHPEALIRGRPGGGVE